MKEISFFIIIVFFYSLPTYSQVVIGGLIPDSSAMLDIHSNSRGLLLPRMTQGQRDSIISPAEGLQIYNLTSHCLELNVGSPMEPIWVKIDCQGLIDSLDCSNVIVSIGLTVHTPANHRKFSIQYFGSNGGAYPAKVIHSTGVEGVTAELKQGYFFLGSYTLEFELSGIPQDSGVAVFAIKIGDNTCNAELPVSVGLVSSLICDKSVPNSFPKGDSVSMNVSIPYSGGNGGIYKADTLISEGSGEFILTYDSARFEIGDGSVFALLNGFSDTASQIEFELKLGGKSCLVTYYSILDTIFPSGFMHCDPKNPTEVVDVINPTTGETWMDRNLGAARIAQSKTDLESYGDLFQWGRFADGHQCRYSLTTDSIASTAEANAGNFWDGKFIKQVEGNNWLVLLDTNLWQGVNGVNNPCPSGYRLPTASEWESERQSWSQNNRDGAYFSPLKLPSSGYRNGNYGAIVDIGRDGFYSSSSVSGSSIIRLNFDHSSNLNAVGQRNGYSVRCIKN